MCNYQRGCSTHLLPWCMYRDNGSSQLQSQLITLFLCPLSLLHFAVILLITPSETAMRTVVRSAFQQLCDLTTTTETNVKVHFKQTYNSLPSKTLKILILKFENCCVIYLLLFILKLPFKLNFKSTNFVKKIFLIKNTFYIQ